MIGRNGLLILLSTHRRPLHIDPGRTRVDSPGFSTPNDLIGERPRWMSRYPIGQIQTIRRKEKGGGVCQREERGCFVREVGTRRGGVYRLNHHRRHHHWRRHGGHLSHIRRHLSLLVGPLLQIDPLLRDARTSTRAVCPCSIPLLLSLNPNLAWTPPSSLPTPAPSHHRPYESAWPSHHPYLPQVDRQRAKRSQRPPRTRLGGSNVRLGGRSVSPR